ncbi:hypothetical protein [Congregicoccus parvus]|uniref:hypothetical protein n=1 Tax=Congregicoccus parvus TaxID=3081749 RepID=UPI003FA5D4BB
MLRHHSLRTIATILVAALAFVTHAPRLLALDAAGSALLAQAEAQLRSLESNLQLARQTAGSGAAAITGTKAKLTRVRLDGAVALVPQVQARLDKLPAEDPAVAPVAARFAAARAGIQELDARLGGSAATTTPSTGAARLGYQQEEMLGNARFHLRELEGMATAVDSVASSLRADPDPTRHDIRTLDGAMATFERCRERIGQIRNHLDPLPADHPEVATVIRALEAATRTIDEASRIVGPAHARLSAALDTNAMADLDADMNRLAELSQMYADIMVFQTDRERAGSLVTDLPIAQAEHDRLVSSYRLLVDQKTPQGIRLDGISRAFRDRVEKFIAAADREKTTLPVAFERDLARVEQLGRQAVEERKPAFFNGGIPQHLGYAEEKARLLEILDPAAGADATARLAAVKEALESSREALRSAIIAANRLPDDVYKGPDRQAVIDRATTMWKRKQPEADVMTVRIPSSGWRREVLWRWSGSQWYKIDRSRMQLQLIVRHDETLALMRAINVWKDHLAGDEITATPLWEPHEGMEPMNFLPIDRVQ